MISRLRFGVLGFAAFVLAACGSTGGVEERLDTATGLTWVAASAPGIYARTDPRYSRAARDYVYVGPVETNARGFREYLLWVGIGSTLDRGFLAPEKEPPNRIAIVVEGEPIDLELFPWLELVGGATSVEPYKPPVRPSVQLGARVTRNLLDRINSASPTSITVSAASGESLEYVAWVPMPRWSGFAVADSAR